jgi:hypothetical protein
LSTKEIRRPVTVIVCHCGKRLSAAGAVPGRVGRCPACGARFQVPEPAPQAPEEVLPQRAPIGPSPSAFVSTPGRSPGNAWDRRSRKARGLIRTPDRLETSLSQSLLYPFWGETGVALLLVMPPFLWLTSLPTISIAALLLAEGVSDSARIGVVFLLPIAAAFALVLGFTLLYLGQVLVSSALGEVHHPRWPRWDLHEMFRGLWRWFWAFVAGVGGGFIPAVAYWIACGDLDPLDVVILVELLALGAVYAQMALLASILHDDPLGANPVTVIQGIVRIGWSYARPCLVSGVALALVIAAFAGLFQIKQPLLAALGLWAFWVLALYLAMVALRVLGLCYHERCRALGWFRERPRWGV